MTAIRGARIDSPEAANNIVTAISALYAWAIEVGEAKVDPCNGIKRLKSGEGWHLLPNCGPYHEGRRTCWANRIIG